MSPASKMTSDRAAMTEPFRVIYEVSHPNPSAERSSWTIVRR
ncbi:MAG: hypothetical protein SXQ77_02045 [Halobacteria archaeon]|nr:hypothetical protein [Halobacteria archaeon]